MLNQVVLFTTLVKRPDVHDVCVDLHLRYFQLHTLIASTNKGAYNHPHLEVLHVCGFLLFFERRAVANCCVT